MSIALVANGKGLSSSDSKRYSHLNDCVSALKKGEPQALEAVISKTQKACYSLALSILKDPGLSQDAVQESYLIVYQRIGQLREPKAFKSWLYRIVTRCCHEILKKRKAETETNLEEREDLLLQDAPPQDDPSRTVSRQLSLKRIFDRLPEIDREALALREVASLSYEEMSRVLAVPLGTVRSRLAKARKRFITAYHKENQDG